MHVFITQLGIVLKKKRNETKNDNSDLAFRLTAVASRSSSKIIRMNSKVSMRKQFSSFQRAPDLSYINHFIVFY